MESDVTDLEAGGVWPIGDVMETAVVSGNLWGGECGRRLMPVKLTGNFLPSPVCSTKGLPCPVLLDEGSEVQLTTPVLTLDDQLP